MIENDKIVLAELASLLIAGKELDDEQERALSSLLDQYPDAIVFLQTIIEKEVIESPINPLKIDVYQEWNKFKERVPKRKDRVVSINFSMRKLASIAAILVCVVMLALLWFRDIQPNYIIKDSIYGHKNDVLPNGKEALLEIDGKFFKRLGPDELGKVINLDTVLGKYKLITPIRSSYSFTLSDGSKIWLSPESELECLSAFTSNERRVKLNGEGFIEVAKDANRPFIVEVDGLEIQALGTAFSVRNYNKEEPRVLLTEGRVLLHTARSETIMDAGYQAEVVNGKVVAEASDHLEDALAIKNGFFNFNNKGIQNILEEIRRWYGVSLQIDRGLGDKKYTGSIERDVTLAKVCSVLKDLTGYQYVIEKDKLIVR